MSPINLSQLSLIPASLEQYPIIQNMARFYVYDISAYCGFEPGWEIPANGLYECIDFKKYWDDANAKPFLIQYKNEWAGFVIIDTLGSDNTIDYNMAQFFILKKFQSQGVGKYIALECFKQFKGVWEIMVMPKNKGAYLFWKIIIAELTQDNFTEYTKTIANLNNAVKDIFRFKTE